VKVLIQDLETLRFLAPNGRWVLDREAARDFFSLLPAYYYAREHTASHFQVLLYCPEDNFSASIIAGTGIAPDQSQVAVADSPKSRTAIPLRSIARRFRGVILPADPGTTRHQLN
jgi:hypothetical protein